MVIHFLQILQHQLKIYNNNKNLTSGSVSYFTFESLRNPLTQTFSASIAYAKGEKEVGVNSKIQIKPTGSFPPQFEIHP